MSKQTRFANESVMESYLGNLLSETSECEVTNVAIGEPEVKAELASQTIDEVEEKTSSNVSTPANEANTALAPLVDTLEERFQALFFDVAGLTLAVPLVSLGGIHQIDKIGPLFGKPSWFKGVMLHREEKLNVVDTAKWVMPEKITQTLEEGLHYSYLVMLAESPWGLACEKLVNTVTLQKSEVKWRNKDPKRPWLAGMVKERMCALIDVYQLVSMLNKGLSSDSQD